MDNKLNQFAHFSAEGRRLSWADMLEQRRGQMLPVQLGKVAIYKAAGNILPRFLARQLGNYRFVGLGGEQVVFQDRDSDHVLKILRSTIGADEEEVSVWAADYQRQSDEAKKHLGHHWLETNFYTLELPFLKRRYAVACTQPSVTPEATFSEMQDLTLYEASEGYVQEVIDFYDSVCSYRQTTGLYPDLFPHNIALTRLDGQPRLQIIDTIPLSPERLSNLMPDGRTLVQDAIERNLNSLGDLKRGLAIG
jgi:hypothetical protein